MVKTKQISAIQPTSYTRSLTDYTRFKCLQSHQFYTDIAEIFSLLFFVYIAYYKNESA